MQNQGITLNKSEAPDNRFTFYFVTIEKISTCDLLKSSNLPADNFKKARNLDGSTSEPVIRACDTGQRLTCFDNHQ